MASNRSTARIYGGGGVPITAADLAAGHQTVQQFHFDNFAAYLRDADRVWGAYDNLVSNSRTTRSGTYTYVMELEVEGLQEHGAVVVSGGQNMLDTVRQMCYDEESGTGLADLFDNVFSSNSMMEVHMRIARVTPAGNGANPSYRAPGRVWGYLGNKLLNCVTKEMMEMVAYYTHEGEKRKFMWDAETGEPYPTDNSHPDYDAEAMRKLGQNHAYRTIKKGIETYMHRRGVKPHEDFGFEPRDLCELADLCKCRIVVWIDCGSFRVCRHDTDDLSTQERGAVDRRYVFNYHMMSNQHLEILPVSTINAEGRSYAEQRVNPGRDPALVYLDDAGFDEILTSEGAKPVEDRRLYVVCKDIRRDAVKKVMGFPDEALGHRYSGWILTSGEKVYKHESLREWTETLLLDGDLDKSAASKAVCLADVHTHRLRALFRKHNVPPLVQRSTPGLYHAARWADMQFGHMQLPMDDDSLLYEYDGRKWYMADFSEMTEDEFPYFHGVPRSNCWSEYSGTYKDVHFVPGVGFKERVSMIGNAPGDRPFTFRRGERYAIFQVEELDLSGVDANVVAHFERDAIFTGFDSARDVMMLPSPIVHFLQDLGAVWRASRAWVCYGNGSHWIPSDTEGGRLAREMVAAKTYPVAMGRLMCGRNPVQAVKYLAPDPETAEALRYFHSVQFAHGRLANEHRTSPDIIFEGEEHEYETEDDLRVDTDPDLIIYANDGEFSGTSEAAHSTVRFGGRIRPVASADEWDGQCPFYVDTYQSTYNWGRTYSHVAGAQHAMCFVRLYQAVVRLDAGDVVGFSLDSIRTSHDVTHLLGGMFGEAPGFFKPVSVKPYRCPVQRGGPMLSDLYTPRYHFTGVNRPDPESPLWNKYKDDLRQFNIVTGKAGSGKTTRHFKAFGTGDEDYRLPRNTVYMTMTNHLAHHMQSELGVTTYTSFKGFNRKLNDDDNFVEAARRFDWAAHQRGGVDNRGKSDVYKLNGVHTVMLDEVSMIDPDKIRDIVEVCQAYHLQLVIVGDLDHERFFQLSPVGHSESDFFDALRTAEVELSLAFHRVPPMRVFRQTGDPELEMLLNSLRQKDGVDAWDELYNSEIIRHITYDQMLEEFDASKDLVAQPWHRLIGKVTADVLERMGPDDVLRFRGNFCSPRKVGGTYEEVLAKLKMDESDDTVFKGSVGKITKKELQDLEGTPLMSKDFPYAGSNNNANEVNPMIGATIFNLQGLTLESDATIYIFTDTPGYREWVDTSQPKLAYVAASRARRRGQIVIVTGERASPPATVGRKRGRAT